MQSLRNAETIISTTGFAEAFYKTWRPRLGERRQNLGFALSGGVDSMALAYLSHRHLESLRHPDHDMNCEAFIVDHKARGTSTEEANLVAAMVEKLIGKPPIVLTLDWPPGIQPSKLSNFETLARRLRYQALGRACRQYDIHDLFVAHHEDDVAETALSRLSDGAGGSGLLGIRRRADIPECWSLHGVHRSRDRVVGTSRISQDLTVRDNFGCQRHTPRCETGGIQICRPLLDFSKLQLISTCQSAGVRWVEDHTNHDPTLTVRNAVRSLLLSGSLPRALQKTSLLACVKTARTKFRALELSAQLLSGECEVEPLDPGTGVVRVHIPDISRGYFMEKTKIADESGFLAACCLFLKGLVETVTPQENLSSQSLSIMADNLFPSDEKRNCFPGRMRPNFTAGSVLFSGTTGPSISLEPDSKWRYTWQLTRQPYGSSDRLPVMSIAPQPLSCPQDKDDRAHPDGSFELWDGRFWISVTNTTAYSLCVRPFRDSDLKAFCDKLPGLPSKLGMKGKLGTACRSLPAISRRSLPAIAVPDDVEPPVGEGRVLSLPSLGLSVPHSYLGGEVKWRIRYKKVRNMKKWASTPISDDT